MPGSLHPVSKEKSSWQDFLAVWGGYHDLHFTNEEAEVQRGWETFYKADQVKGHLLHLTRESHHLRKHQSPGFLMAPYYGFLGLLNKSPQTGWLKATEMHFKHLILEARSLKSRCKKRGFLLFVNLYHACLLACGMCDLLVILGLGLLPCHPKLCLHFHRHSQGHLLIRTAVRLDELTPCT